ncbi:MAG: hypothetical protein WAN26_11790 [Steroidobacteraceae bacterium]
MEADPPSALESQVAALVQRVTDDREQRCRQIRTAAESQAREITRSGRAEARASVHKAVSAERVRIAQALRQAQARAELEGSRRAQLRTRSLLEQMWAQIGATLAARWQDPGHRRSWIDAALRQADLLLSGQAWRIEHGADWSSEERARLENLAAKGGARTIEWRHDPALRSGLRVRCAGVCLDATVDGLLARRADIEADFLAEYLAHE